MPYAAPHSDRTFDPACHFLRRGRVSADSGASLADQVAKTPQSFNLHHVVQIPKVDNMMLCPVRTLRAFLSSRSLPTLHTLFVNNFPPFSLINDKHIMDALKTALTSFNISPVSHSFHSFRRSGTTFAFDHNYGPWSLEEFSHLDLSTERLSNLLNYNKHLCCLYSMGFPAWVSALKF